MSSSSYSNPSTPLLIYIIICFFGVLMSVIFYKGEIAVFPSVFTMSTQFSFVLISCLILIVVGTISVRIEWLCMVICALLFFFNVLCIINPDILLYGKLS